MSVSRGKKNKKTKLQGILKGKKKNVVDETEKPSELESNMERMLRLSVQEFKSTKIKMLGALIKK